MRMTISVALDQDILRCGICCTSRATLPPPASRTRACCSRRGRAQPKQLAQHPCHRAYSTCACIEQHAPTPYALYVIHPDAALVLEGSCAKLAVASRGMLKLEFQVKHMCRVVAAASYTSTSMRKPTQSQHPPAVGLSQHTATDRE